MSISDLLDRWFESEQMKTIMMVDGLIGQWAGPDEPGTAYVLLHHAIGGVGGESAVVNWGFPQGGMGAVSGAIRGSAEAFGAEIRTGSPVARILTRNGRATGVTLVNGDELHAPTVVSCVHPQVGFLQLVDRDDLPADFLLDIESWKSRSGVVKINVAMSELPDFIADPGTELARWATSSVPGSAVKFGSSLIATLIFTTPERDFQPRCRRRSPLELGPIEHLQERDLRMHAAHHDRGGISSPDSSATPTARPLLARMRSTRAPRCGSRSRRTGQTRAIDAATAPMPPCGKPQLTVWLAPPTLPIAWCSST